MAEWNNTYFYAPYDSYSFLYDQFPPKGRDYGFYCNPALDALYTEELATTDADARQQIFRQIHAIYLTQFPFITLYSPTGSFAMVRKGTHNYQLSNLDANINIWKWWCDNGKC